MNVLFFVQPGTNSRSTLLDLMKGFRRSGHDALHLDLEPVWSAVSRVEHDQALRYRLVSEFTAMVRTFLEENRIDLSVAMWANALTSMSAAAGPGGAAGARAMSIFDLIPQKHLCYWLDAPQWAHDGELPSLMGTPLGDLLRSGQVYHAINNAATGAEMGEVFGMRNVIPQHYGIDEETFRPREATKEFDIVFALGPGDPPPTGLMLEMLDAREPDIDAIRHEQAERLRGRLLAMATRFKVQAGAAGAVLEALLQSQLADRHTPVLARLKAIGATSPSARSAMAELVGNPRLFVDVSMTVRLVESWERAFTLTYLSRHLKCAVFGPGGQTLDAWGTSATRLGELNWEEQSAAYARGRLGLNVMRWQDDEGLNVKPYEITASGTACLCARRRGIDTLFAPGEEIAVFEGPAEARRVAEELLSDSDRLSAMAAAGRARTLRDYTWTAVARDLMDAMA
jgi:spore maturation protein CgeB